MKSGFVAVAGRPNVGKSTLVNALVGEKIAITSAVPNTTRRRVFGVANDEDWQLVLVDLPGFQKPMDKLTQRMQKTVDTSFEDIDAVLFVLSARDRVGGGDRFIARRVYGLGKPVIVAVNKVDNLKPSHIITQMKAAAQLGDFHALHPVSAKTKDGIDELRSDLVYLLPEGQPYFPREAATDQTSEERISELIREKALQLTRDEVPHSISVEIDELDEKLLRAFVLVETESQKQILVGKKGAMIREIGTRARPEIEALLGHKIFLELVVKVRPKWRRDDSALERLGLKVERLSFGADVAFSPPEELLDSVTIAPLTAPVSAGAPFQGAVFRLAPGGRIVRHPATVPQLLAVLEGSGEVSGSDGVAQPIGPGEAVFWEAGEEHETTSASGLTALILEGDALEPYRRRS